MKRSCRRCQRSTNARRENGLPCLPIWFEVGRVQMEGRCRVGGSAGVSAAPGHDVEEELIVNGEQGAEGDRLDVQAAVYSAELGREHLITKRC